MPFTVSTKKNKTGISVNTKLTVVYDNPEAERALATQALVVKLQGMWRKSSIPEAFTAKMSKYAPGTRHGEISLEDAIKVLTPEERKALIAKLQAE